MLETGEKVQVVINYDGEKIYTDDIMGTAEDWYPENTTYYYERYTDSYTYWGLFYVQSSDFRFVQGPEHLTNPPE